MKIEVRQVIRIPVTYDIKDNYYEFAWIASCFRNGKFSGWHLSVF